MSANDILRPLCPYWWQDGRDGSLRFNKLPFEESSQKVAHVLSRWHFGKDIQFQNKVHLALQCLLLGGMGVAGLILQNYSVAADL